MLLPVTSIQIGPLFVHSGSLSLRRATFWNLDAMWETAYSRANCDETIEIVFNVRDLADSGIISTEQMTQWVSRRSPQNGSTLLDQVKSAHLAMAFQYF